MDIKTAAVELFRFMQANFGDSPQANTPEGDAEAARFWETPQGQVICRVTPLQRLTATDEDFIKDWNELIVEGTTVRSNDDAYAYALAHLLIGLERRGTSSLGTVVDVGCGLMYLPQFLIQHGITSGPVVGVEPSGAYIRQVMERAREDGLSGLRVVRGYPWQLGLADSVADAVLCLDVLHECKHYLEMLGEISRVAKRDAVVVVSYCGCQPRRVNVEPRFVAQKLEEFGISVIRTSDSDKGSKLRKLVLGIKR